MEIHGVTWNASQSTNAALQWHLRQLSAVQARGRGRTWWGKPECSTELRAISQRSVAVSFHTCAATLYSSTNGSFVRWICAATDAVSLHVLHLVMGMMGVAQHGGPSCKGLWPSASTLAQPRYTPPPVTPLPGVSAQSQMQSETLPVSYGCGIKTALMPCMANLASREASHGTRRPTIVI